MTGVLPGWRNRSIATALKLAGIRYAQSHNAKRLDTQNDARQPPNDRPQPQARLR